METQRPEEHPREWGTELWIANESEYSGKILLLKDGWMSTVHYHKEKLETLYIREGKLVMQLFDDKTVKALERKQDALLVPREEVVVLPGSSLLMPRLQAHRLIALSDVEIIEFATHCRDEDSFRLTARGRLTEAERARLEGLWKARKER